MYVEHFVIQICKVKTIINQYNNQTKRTQEIEKKKIEKKIAKP